LTATRFFSTSEELQDFLLRESSGCLTVVPHQRLAHQLWHRQRLQELAAGRAAWEPLPLITLQGWLADLFRSRWPREVLAPDLTRLALWRRALKTAPPPAGPTPELQWAQALDETYNLLCRHSLVPAAGGDARPTKAAGEDAPLTAWRRQVTRAYVRLLREEGWLSPGELPGYLLGALQAGKIRLPDQVLVVGLETPAPAEAAWLQAVASHTRVAHLQVRGDIKNITRAVVLPDRGQELEWVAASLLEAAQTEGLPLHRLAVTSPDMDHYAPQLLRVLAELLGPAQSAGGWAYNASRGPSLGDAPLFRAAVLPVQFAGAENREDLVSLLLSPYCSRFQSLRPALARWDRSFREHRADRGWERLRGALVRDLEPRETEETLARLDRLWPALQMASARGREWAAGLRAAWRVLGFPGDLDEAEAWQWDRLLAALTELERALGAEALSAAEFLEWLTLGVRQVALPGPGVQEAGVQILGLLEMRGLAFSRVFCLGLNAGAFPPPPRALPLLDAGEKRAVLGGTYQSQHEFARELFNTFLGTAPEIILTRPRLADDEERVGSPFFLGKWEARESAVLSRPQAAWLRSPAVQAAFQSRNLPPWAGYGGDLLQLSLPDQLSLSQVAVALQCPCRFLLEILLAVKELPEIQAGLDPRERGEMLHRVLARFTADFKEHLLREQAWDGPRAREILPETARRLLGDRLPDPHWQAEWDRWLGEAGLLWEWLAQEEQRWHQGWRWHGMEVRFQELKGRDWRFALRGRIDRLDCQEGESRLMVWDYKTGEVPTPKKVFEDSEEHQLPCYLLAVRQGCVEVPPGTAELGAGFIGLKSSREKHLRYEDFGKKAARWPEVLAAWEERVRELGQRLAAGDFRPDPVPAPAGKRQGACQYCAYTLVCGFSPNPAPEEEEDGD
jgi:RecB family exonuclease